MSISGFLQGETIKSIGGMRRAAAYVRMSTDQQRYSIENQMRVINDYAAARGVGIVRTYADAGRSGLSMRSREGLRQLILDVTEGRAEFELILAYDVSRWGRFQDIDESAHYEFICRKAGVAVEYCAEMFRNDGSMVASLLKGMKRAMAWEFSRELSEKISRGHSRLAQEGFHQGGAAGFGLRRVLVDRQRRRKRLLEAGQEKALQDDRVILAPGPEGEWRIVLEVFRLFVEDGKSPRHIAAILNNRGLRNGRGNPWNQHNVRAMLRSERYIGTLVYNRTSLKLQGKRVYKPEHQWVRAAGAIEPMVDAATFGLAKAKIKQPWAITSNDLLDHLASVWCVRGYLSCTVMKSVLTCPVPNTYRERFGSLEEAYRLIGYKRTHTYRYAGTEALLRKIDREMIGGVIAAGAAGGLSAHIERNTPLIQVEGGPTIATVVLPYRCRGTRRPGWWLHFDRVTRSDLLLVARMNVPNTELLDIHLLPFPVVCGPTFRFTAEGMQAFASYRLNGLQDFCAVLQRVSKRTAGRSCP